MCVEDCPECTDRTCAMHKEWKSDLETGDSLPVAENQNSTVNLNKDNSKSIKSDVIKISKSNKSDVIKISK